MGGAGRRRRGCRRRGAGDAAAEAGAPKAEDDKQVTPSRRTTLRAAAEVAAAASSALALLVLLCALAASARSCRPRRPQAQAKDWRIDNLDATLDVQENGDVIVDETVTFNFKGNYHFVTRAIPTDNMDGMTDIEVYDANGSRFPRATAPGTYSVTNEGRPQDHPGELRPHRHLGHLDLPLPGQERGHVLRPGRRAALVRVRRRDPGAHRRRQGHGQAAGLGARRTR